MEYKTIIKSLNHEDLVAFFSTALYGSDIFTADYDDKYHKLTTPGTCFEDKLADILLGGGEIIITDLESEEDETPYGKQGVNWVTTTIEDIMHRFWGTIDVTRHIGYHITLNTIIKAINENVKAQDLAKELLIDEDGDLFVAQDLLQYCIFGEPIYG